MKSCLRQTVFFVFLGLYILSSCKKETAQLPPPPPPTPVVPTYTTGKVFLLNSVWEIDSLDLGPAFKSVIALVYPTDSLPISAMLNRSVQVFIQVDSSSNWVYVPYEGSNANNGYVWYLQYVWGFFEIESYPANFQLAGKPVKVKVKI